MSETERAPKKRATKGAMMRQVWLWPTVTLVVVVALIAVFRMRNTGAISENPGLVALLVLLLLIIGSVTMFGLTILRNLFLPDEDGDESQIDLRKRALRDEVERLKAERAAHGDEGNPQ